MGIACFEVFLIALIVLLGACRHAPYKNMEVGKDSQTNQKDIERGRITSIAFEEFFLKHLRRELLLIDSRDLWFYKQGRIPGAISLPTGKTLNEAVIALNTKLMEATDKNHEIIVYCNGIGCHDARTVSRAIAKHGYHVRTFSGGWKAWKKYGLPVESASQDAVVLPPQTSP